MNNEENETAPINYVHVKRSSISSSNLNSSNYIKNNNVNLNITSDCDSLISAKDEKNPEKKVFFEKVYKTKHDSKSILNIAKDLNSNIRVSF